MLQLNQVKELMSSAGATRLLVKHLAPNDNSKNQPYFGPDLNSLAFIPTGEVEASVSTSKKSTSIKEAKFQAALNFFWLLESGDLRRAPESKLIFYPQYPEVRFSGFLQGCKGAPSELMNPARRGREDGRVLLIGICPDGRVLGYVTDRASPVARALSGVADRKFVGVFEELELGPGLGGVGSEAELLEILCRIHSKGWIESKRLLPDGTETHYRAPNGGGLTLEAEFGITPNGISEPDYRGWEIKAFTVSNIEKPGVGRVTLMTPEPNGGVYANAGALEFMNNYGYPDTKGRNRRNFCGVHRHNQQHPRTGLRLVLPGYDPEDGRITDSTKGLTLIDQSGDEAAVWSYAKIIEHWRKKHARTVFVPMASRKRESSQYRFSKHVSLGKGTEILRLLGSIANGSVYYDPGIILYEPDSPKPRIKKRSQFRASTRDLGSLYEEFSKVSAC